MEAKPILVVAPEPIYIVIQAYFTLTESRLVHCATQGQALETSATANWAAVFVCQQLLDGSGFVVLEQLRQQYANLPIIVLGEDETSAIVKALRLGASDYIVLPSLVSELPVVLKRLMCERNGTGRELYSRQEVSAMLHEISNPLTPIIGLSEMLLEDLPSEHPAHKSASDIRAAAWRLQDIIRRFRTSSAAKSPQDAVIG
jgi:DNA-binding response OmpR family regulator